MSSPWAIPVGPTRRVLSLWTQTILPSVLTAVLFLAVFGGALVEDAGDECERRDDDVGDAVALIARGWRLKP